MAAKDVRWINHIKKWYDDVNPILDTPRLLGAQQTLRSVPARIGYDYPTYQTLSIPLLLPL
jgi:hypothetical protein